MPLGICVSRRRLLLKNTSRRLPPGIIRDSISIWTLTTGLSLTRHPCGDNLTRYPVRDFPSHRRTPIEACVRTACTGVTKRNPILSSTKELATNSFSKNAGITGLRIVRSISFNLPYWDAETRPEWVQSRGSILIHQRSTRLAAPSIGTYQCSVVGEVTFHFRLLPRYITLRKGQLSLTLLDLCQSRVGFCCS